MYRDTEVDLDLGRSQLFVDPARAGRVLPLTGLGSADLAVLVAGTVEGHVSAGWIESLTERTGGNPFIAKEVLRLLAARGGASDRALASLPPSVITSSCSASPGYAVRDGGPRDRRADRRPLHARNASLAALLGRAEVARRAGDPEAARADLMTVVEGARRRTDPALLGRAARGRARLGPTSGHLQPEGGELLEDAADGLGDDEADLRALVLSALATELWDPRPGPDGGRPGPQPGGIGPGRAGRHSDNAGSLSGGRLHDRLDARCRRRAVGLARRMGEVARGPRGTLNCTPPPTSSRPPRCWSWGTRVA